MDPTHLTARIKEKAHALGFDWARVVPVDAGACRLLRSLGDAGVHRRHGLSHPQPVDRRRSALAER
ncbi:MAG: hypothetical protein R3A10_14550 [Caldilineaceae bacterium]